MTIKTIVGVYEKMKSGGFLESLSNEGLQSDVFGILDELMNNAEVARSTIISKMTEEQFVKLLTMIQKMSVTLGAMEGDMQVLKADMLGELRRYTHTVVLATIGALIEDEIL